MTVAAMGGVVGARVGAFLGAFLGALVGCGGPPGHAGDGAAAAPGSDGPQDVIRPDAPADTGPCQCKLDSDRTLSLSWGCYCAQPLVGCDVPLAVASSCADVERVDYPACGLTLVVDYSPGTSEGLPSVYDPSGALVGRLTRNTLSVFTCPSDPSLSSALERAGRFPDASCLGVSCASCYAGSFPCPGVDAGTDGLARYDGGGVEASAD